MPAMLPNMFPSFDDKIALIRPVAEAIYTDDLETFPADVEKFIDIITIPGVHFETCSTELLSPSGHSQKQLEGQEWLRKELLPKINFKNLPNPAKLAVASIAAVVYSTGSMGIAASSPEIQRYDESAFASGVGGYSII